MWDLPLSTHSFLRRRKDELAERNRPWGIASNTHPSQCMHVSFRISRLLFYGCLTFGFIKAIFSWLCANYDARSSNAVLRNMLNGVTIFLRQSFKRTHLSSGYSLKPISLLAYFGFHVGLVMWLWQIVLLITAFSIVKKNIIVSSGGDDESETGQSVGLAGFYVNGVWIPFIDELTAKKSFILFVSFSILFI